MVAFIFKLSPWEAEVGRFLLVCGQPGLYKLPDQPGPHSEKNPDFTTTLESSIMVNRA